MIHPTAIVDKNATIDASCDIGPFCVIDSNVQLGPNCRLGPGVYITGHTIIGSGNVFHAGTVIGDAPQDMKYQGQPTRLVIGDQNLFREHVTIHRSNKMEENTVIGSNNFFMAHSHVGHNSRIGNHVILANGALVAGHVEIQNRAFISGNCLIHQFVRVGSLALMQGGAGISKDLPPFCIATGVNQVCGLNVIGLRRAGIPAEQRAEIKRLYKILLLGDENFRDRLSRAESHAVSASGKQLISFARDSKRGLCAATQFSRQATEDSDPDASLD